MARRIEAERLEMFGIGQRHGREGVDWSHCLPDPGQDRRARAEALPRVGIQRSQKQIIASALSRYTQ